MALQASGDRSPCARRHAGGAACGRSSWRRHLLALPGVGWTVVFFLAPLGLLLVYSFGSTNLLTFQVEFGWTFSNYPGIFQSLYLDPIAALVRPVGRRRRSPAC